jgi:hypothetical protein
MGKTMEDRVQRYARSLEKVILNNHQYLKETIKDFQKKCHNVGRGRNIPPQIITDIRQTNKEIQDRFREIRAIQEVLQRKYRSYYRRDFHLDREINEIGSVARAVYSKFECELNPTRIRSKQGDLQSTRSQKALPLLWFRSKENQVMLLRNLSIPHDLDYQMPSDSKNEERRKVDQNKPRSLTLFVFSGDAKNLENLAA